MIHRGEIVEQAVRASGHKLSQLALKLGKSRKWLYDAFENPMLSIEHILEIGRIIHHDFIQDIPELRRNYLQTDNAPEVEEVKWKDKYITLLEEHQKLLERFLAMQEGKVI